MFGNFFGGPFFSGGLIRPHTGIVGGHPFSANPIRPMLPSYHPLTGVGSMISPISGGFHRAGNTGYFGFRPPTGFLAPHVGFGAFGGFFNPQEAQYFGGFFNPFESLFSFLLP